MTSSWPGLNESKPKISFRTLRGTMVNIRPHPHLHKGENRAFSCQPGSAVSKNKKLTADSWQRGDLLAKELGLCPLAPVWDEFWDRCEALYLAVRPVAAVLRIPNLFGLALFDGVEEVVEGASYLQARPGVCEPEPEGRRREAGQDAEEEERALHPREYEQSGQRGPEDAGEREVLAALVGEVRRQVGLAPLLAETIDAHFEQPCLEECPLPREVQRPPYDPELVAGVPQRADLRLAPELETLFEAQQSFEVFAGGPGGALYLPHGPEAGGTVELAGVGVRFGRLLRGHVPHGPVNVLFGDTGRRGHLHQDLGGDRRGVSDATRPPARVEFRGAAQDPL